MSGSVNFKVSVLLPFYRPGAFFDEAIKSVLHQDYNDFELLLINNNSDKVSVEKALYFSNNYKNVKLIDEPCRGIAHALNTGLRQSSSKYIARMDADDICLQGRFKLQAQFLDDHKDIDAVTGLVKYKSSDNNGEGMKLYVEYINSLRTEQDIFNFRFVDSPFAHPSIMYRKSLIDKYGMYSTDSVPEDFELWLRWFNNQIRISKLPEEILEWRDHSTRLSRNNDNYSASAFNKVRISYLLKHLKKANTPARPLYVWGTGKLAKQKVRLMNEIGITPDGYIDLKKGTEFNGKKVLNYRELPEPGQIFVVTLVSNRGKQKEIFNFLRSVNYVPDKDFIIGS